MFSLFESRSRRERDAMELQRLFRQYGDRAIGVLKARMKNSTLSRRDRRHWRRLLRKARRTRHQFSSKSTAS